MRNKIISWNVTGLNGIDKKKMVKQLVQCASKGSKYLRPHTYEARGRCEEFAFKNYGLIDGWGKSIWRHEVVRDGS